MNIDITNKKNKYLYSLDNEDSCYLKGFKYAITTLKPYLSNGQFKNLQLDLQIGRDSFDEAKYLQAACETTISATLAAMYPNSFKYEVKTNPPKDVDCGFEVDGYKYNLEIKCPDYSKKNKIDQSSGLKIGSLGRLDDFSEVVQMLQGVFSTIQMEGEKQSPQLHVQQHMDNKLKDYLLSAHGKFNPTVNDKELNVLAICCDDPTDMQKWFYYMYGPQGLFMPDSFYERSEFNRVDVVILTNLYHRHFDFISKDKLSDHWDFSKSFNLIFSNPTRKCDKANEIFKLTEAIPNYSWELFQYELPHDVNELRLSTFVAEELTNKGKFYFQPRI